MSADAELEAAKEELARRQANPDPSLEEAKRELAARTQGRSVMDTVKKFGALAVPGGSLMKGLAALDHAAYDAGGAVAGAAGGVGVPAPIAAGAGVATNLAIQFVPAVLGGAAAKASAAPEYLANWARGWMQSALKPSKGNMLSGKGDKAITTLLDEGAGVTEGGLEALQGKIGELNLAVEDAINRWPFGRVNKAKVADELRPVFEKYIKQSLPQADMEAINSAFTKFMDHPLLKNSSEIPVTLAQELKQGTYRALGDKAYGLGLKPAAERDAQKALAHGLREGIAAEVPGINALNAKEGDLINAANMVEERLATSGNKNPLGLGILNPKTLALWILDRSEFGKSLVARSLHSGQEAIPTAAGAAVGGAEGAYMGRRRRLADAYDDKGNAR